MRINRLAYCTLLGVVFAFFQWNCGKGNVTKEQGAAAETPKQELHCISDTLAKMMETDVVRVENIEDELRLSGEVSFNQDKVLRIMPLVSGIVSEVKVSIGDYVQAGQVLATIRSAEIAGGQNDVVNAQVAVDAAEKTLANTEVRYKNGLASELDFNLAKSELTKAKSNLDKAKETLSIYGNNSVGKTSTVSIKSPISGYVVEKKINNGSQVRTDNADNLFTISSLQDVWILANVYENDISRIKEGFEAKVTTLAYPGKEFTGKIEKVSQVIDPADKAMKIRVVLNNKDHLLKPEMFTAVVVRNNAGIKALTVPASAPIMDYGHIYVIVLHDNCHYEAREVHPLKTVGDKTYIKDGLKEGEKVVTKEELLLYNALKEI